MDLDDWRVAFVAAEDDLDETDILDPIRVLREAGAHVDVIGARKNEISVLRRHEAGTTEKVSIPADRKLDQVTPASYGALVLPAAVLKDECLLVESDVLDLVRKMRSAGKPVVCMPSRQNVEAGKPAARQPWTVSLKRLLADSFQNYNAINAPRLGAALAYYTVLSLAPLLILIVAIAGLVLQRPVVQGDLIARMQELIGREGAKAIEAVLESAQESRAGIIASGLGLLTLLLSASGVFLELRDSLDTVWAVKPNYGAGLLSLIRARSFAFVLVLSTGFLLVVSLALSALIAAAGKSLSSLLPAPEYLAQLWTAASSFAVITLLFALIYKVVPDLEIGWGDVWIGAVGTSTLFTTGKVLIGLYLGKASVGSAYGAAGSLVVLIVWVYYSAQIFLFGAEFTHVYAMRHGSYAKQRPAPTPARIKTSS